MAEHKEEKRDGGKVRVSKNKALGSYVSDSESVRRTVSSERLKDWSLSKLQATVESGLNVALVVSECKREAIGKMREIKGSSAWTKEMVEAFVEAEAEECARKKAGIGDYVTVEVPFDEMLGALSEEKSDDDRHVGRIVRRVLDMQNALWYTWKRIRYDRDSGTFSEELGRSAAIPSISFVLTDDGAGIFGSVVDLIESKIPNKKSFIKSVRMRFDRSLVFNHAILTGRYAVIDTSKRKMFDTPHAFRLDEILEAYGIDLRDGKTVFFNAKHLMSCFGYSMSRVTAFRDKVLLPAVGGINASVPEGGRHIEMTEAGRGKSKLFGFRYAMKKPPESTKAVPADRDRLFSYIATVGMNEAGKTCRETIDMVGRYSSYLQSVVGSIDADTVIGGVPAFWKGGAAAAVKEWESAFATAMRAEARIMSGEYDLIMEDRDCEYSRECMTIINRSDGTPAVMAGIRCVDPATSEEALLAMIKIAETKNGEER